MQATLYKKKMEKKSDETHINKTIFSEPAGLRKQHEESLNENEERYRNIIENIEEGYFEVDLAGNFTYFNDTMCRVLGYLREELMGMNYRQYTDKEDLKKVFQAYNKVYKTGKTNRDFSQQIIRKDGTKRYFEGYISLQKDSSGKPRGFRGILRDITERKQTERILRENEERLRGITQNLPGIIFQFYAKDNGKYGISYVSERLSEFSKIFVNLDTTNLDSLFPLFLSRIHEEDRDGFLTSIKTAVGTETPWNFEGRVVIQSDEVIWVQGLSTPTRYADQLVFNGILLNITVRKRMEETIRESEKQYRTFFNTSSDCVFITSIDGSWIDMNDAAVEFFGYSSRDELMQISIPDLYVKKEERTKFINNLIGKGSSKNYPIDMRRKDGGVINTLLTSNLRYDANGKATELMGTIKDITEYKTAAEAIRKSELKYRNIFVNAIEGIYQSTIEGRFITANAALARMAGYDSPEELIASIKNIETQLYVHPKDRERFKEIRDAKGFVEGFEVEFYKKDKSTFWVVINARAVKNEQGEILYNEGLIEDITIRKYAEKQLQQTLESLRKAVGTTIQVLVAALESRDPYTSGHQSRSADLACAIAREMGLSRDKIEGIRMAAIIHDIGKLSIPTEILSKPTKLTGIEFSLIKQHSRSGYEMLKNVESPWPLAEIIYQHHERMNGTGYPRNLKGNEILTESQILAVADVVEAMASHRPYRPTLGIEAALEEIEKNKGILYDDAVANACLRLFREKGFQLT